MRAIAFGEECQPGAIEFHSREMHVIRILPRHDPARTEADFALFDIDRIDAANDPLAGGNRVLHRAGFRVDEVQVVPAGAFAHPHDLTGFVEVTQYELVRVIEKRLARFVDERRRSTRIRIDGNDANDAVPALIVKEREPRTIGRPMLEADVPRVAEEFVGHGDFFRRRDVEEVRFRLRNFVAGLQVKIRRHFRLKLFPRRRFDERHIPRGTRRAAVRDQFQRIRRPEELAVVAVVRLPVGRQATFDFAFAIAQPDVVLLRERFPFSIG